MLLDSFNNLFPISGGGDVCDTFRHMLLHSRPLYLSSANDEAVSAGRAEVVVSRTVGLAGD
jgi:hypothetical protein